MSHLMGCSWALALTRKKRFSEEAVGRVLEVPGAQLGGCDLVTGAPGISRLVWQLQSKAGPGNDTI